MKQNPMNMMEFHALITSGNVGLEFERGQLFQKAAAAVGETQEQAVLSGVPRSEIATLAAVSDELGRLRDEAFKRAGLLIAHEIKKGIDAEQLRRIEEREKAEK